MKAVRFSGARDVRLIETDIPQISENDVLLKVCVSGICGGDSRHYPGAAQRQDVTPGQEVGAELWRVGKAVKGLNDG